ncbi:hypothetical protein BFV94_4414 [Alteromonas macleodii]|uniref:Uncharacterized protein n=1 Tax=Alteromonas macleodii TaxID=28108 RepID=A0AB36FR22_ALTMA|nr:hypothetical protein BFV95_4771 [Alteromonas macleodii]OES25561.1 hypothetical protein BFV94_4414 [Alteromonas macleodii]OES25862.1 hypothetical protein BFV93_4325 [Alteromonas macleodii]OES38616.1 hypothetical protein BFV96_4727 [Alteromonas macleodii]
MPVFFSASAGDKPGDRVKQKLGWHWCCQDRRSFALARTVQDL